jgi:hypothetical protein
MTSVRDITNTGRRLPSASVHQMSPCTGATTVRRRSSGA